MTQINAFHLSILNHCWIRVFRVCAIVLTSTLTYALVAKLTKIKVVGMLNCGT